MKIKRVCLHCGKEFFCYPCHIKNGGGKYCSIQCHLAIINTDKDIKKKSVIKTENLTRGKIIINIFTAARERDCIQFGI